MEGLFEFLPLLMFAALGVLLFSGFPVAFVLGGVGLGFWALAASLGLVSEKSFLLVISRIYGGVVEDLVLVAIPMFIFMGVMLEKSGVARDLLLTLQQLMRRVPGGLALAVVLLGVVMAASTGIIGASVVMMTLMALPVMAEKKYDLAFASGTIAASGTLGILIPPSIMLVVMGNLLSVSIGTLFFAALMPGLLLAGLYLAYVVGFAALFPVRAPGVHARDREALGALMFRAARTFLPPVALIVLVLGSIFAGVATPTEASGIGAAGAAALALARRKLTLAVLHEVVQTTALIGAMLFGIFVGATCFSFVFTLLGGNELIIGFVEALNAGPWSVLIIIMLVVFVLGFFFDWIQISLIVLPVFAPVVRLLDFSGHLPFPEMTVTWFAILVAVNLQTSFLTPPFGFALFYLKGAAPKTVRMQDVYRGIVPFVALQLLGLAAVMAWPEIALWLPVHFGL
ncbi:MAG TPA: TRAP transporter large permease subunit [Sphingomonadales bacterium]|nr:TRAP transporter large permease subunit [Sphingomonadales bacterium]